MAQEVIDRNTGQLKFSNEFIISKRTTAKQIVDYFGEENVEFRDVQTGWKHFSVRNAKIGDAYLNLTFYFERDILNMISFTVSDKFFIEGSWDNWSLENELEKQKYYDQWLTKEIGAKREFDWGTIVSFYDNKGGFSSIVLKYIIMQFKISFCDPFKKDIVELGRMPETKALEIFKNAKWDEYLSKMKTTKEEDIFFSPSFEIENAENINALSISAVGEPNNFEFYIFYKRPKMIKLFFGIIKRMKEDYITDITGQTEKDALDCLNALMKNDLEFLENKIK